MPDFYDPTSDVLTGWETTGGNHYGEIDDGIRYPNQPTLADYVRTNSNGAIDEWGFPTVTGSPPTIDAWLYVETGSNATIQVSLQQGGVERASRTVPVNTTKRWVSLDWHSPSGDLSTLTIEATMVKSGGGAGTYAYVYAAYLNTFNLDKQTAASGDDGTWRTGDVFATGDTTSIIGYVSAVPWIFHYFARWIGVTYEGTVNVSYIECYQDVAPTGTAELKVYGVDEDNPDAPTSAAEFVADPLTTANVTWDGAWTEGAWNQSGSLNTIFQELVDTYTIDNEAVMAQIKNDQEVSNSYNRTRNWDFAGNLHGPKLHIEYTPAGGAGKPTHADNYMRRRVVQG